MNNLIDQFFTDGGLRAQLIGKLLTLTDQIQDNMFALKVMKESDESIQKIKVKGPSVTKAMQEMFLEDLLGPYKTLERSFRQNIYLLMKATEFKTLWSYDQGIGFTTKNSEAARKFINLTLYIQGIFHSVKYYMLHLQNKVIISFSLEGNGRLIAVQELVGAMGKLRSHHQKAEDCFSKFRSSKLILSWTYDTEENTEVIITKNTCPIL